MRTLGETVAGFRHVLLSWLVLTTYLVICTEVLASPNRVISLGPEENAHYVTPMTNQRSKRRSQRACRSNITVTGSGGTLRSPGYPDSYLPDTNCEWLLNAADGTSFIELTIIDLNIELDDHKCRYDSLTIYAGTNAHSLQLYRFCGEIRGRTILTNSSTVFLLFRSDDNSEETGFEVQYKLQREQSCKTTMSGLHGTISSPLYPHSYPDNSNCWTVITVEVGKIVALEFKTLTLEVDDNCTYDYVEIFDGLDQTARRLGRYCRMHQIKATIYSSGNSLAVRFRSDHIVTDHGYLANYAAVSRRGAPTPTTKRPAVQHFPPFLLEKPKNASVIEGVSHVMRCRSNISEAKIHWYLNGEAVIDQSTFGSVRILDNNNTLWIQSMAVILQGVYTCYVATPYTVVAAQATLTMTSPSHGCNVVLKLSPTDQQLTEGDELNLECAATSLEVRITWEKNGLPLALGNRAHVIRDGSLWIRSVSSTDEGLYTCMARGKQARCLRKVTVRVVVASRLKIQEVCGKPLVGTPSKVKPQFATGQKTRIVGGQETDRGAYPWQASLWLPNITFCGGSILNERWVLTAAHCRLDSTVASRWKDVLVKLGKHDQSSKELGEITTTVQNVITHPDYNPATTDNDIALIRLPVHVIFTNFILPVCLGERQQIESLFFSGEKVVGTVTGWGQLSEFGPQPRFLRELRLPIVKQETCIKSSTLTITKNMFCAGYTQELVGDACQGDSGGPFVASDSQRWYLLGIVSWGEGCDQKDKYGIYTKVDNYLPWIKGIANL